MTHITRENIDNLLNHHRIEISNGHGRWYQIRRNGETKYWKRDPDRISIPVTKSDFVNVSVLKRRISGLIPNWITKKISAHDISESSEPML